MSDTAEVQISSMVMHPIFPLQGTMITTQVAYLVVQTTS